MSDSQNIRTHRGKEFTLLQIMPPNGIHCVYAVRCEDDDRQFNLVSWALDALALAEVVEYEYTNYLRGGKNISHDKRELERYRSVVGLELDDTGIWNICEECSNFAGYCRAGKDFQKVTGFLTRDYLKNLRSETATLKGEPNV